MKTVNSSNYIKFYRDLKFFEKIFNLFDKKTKFSHLTNDLP